MLLLYIIKPNGVILIKLERYHQIMIRFFQKTTLVTLIVCFTTFLAKAQLGYNYSRYDLGVGMGIDKISGDVLTPSTTAAVHFNFSYNQTPYTNFVFEVQLGRLSGADASTAPKGRQFTSNLTAFVFRGQLQFGEFLDYSRSPIMNAVKNLYVSAGFGYEATNITFIQRYSVAGIYTAGLSRSQAPFIPIRIGYEFKMFNTYQEPTVKFDIGYEYNEIFGDNLDGFTSGKSNDAYGQFTIGVKFAITGDVTSYRKQITY